MFARVRQSRSTWQKLAAIAAVWMAAASMFAARSGAERAMMEEPPDAAPTRVLLVLTNHSELGDTQKRTGAFLSEVAEPWAVFKEAGYEVTLASPNGGDAPLDPKSLRKVNGDSQKFLDEFAKDGVVPNTTALSDVDPAKYDAIFFTGGHGAMWDFATSDAVAKCTQAMYDQGKVVAAICHGPAALVQLKNAKGEPLVSGRRVTGFTDSEEQAGRLADVVPFLLETRLRALGAKFDGARNFKENVVVDGQLITGQNPASAKGAARAVVKALAARQ